MFMKNSKNFVKSPLKVCLIAQILVHSLWHVWKGAVILWHRKQDKNITRMSFDEDKIIGIKFEVNADLCLYLFFFFFFFFFFFSQVVSTLRQPLKPIILGLSGSPD